MKSVILLALLFLFTGYSYAQKQIPFKVIVLEEGSNLSIKDAEVRIKQLPEIRNYTDSNGIVIFDNVPEKKLEIVVTKPGYKPKKDESWNVNSKSQNILEVELEKEQNIMHGEVFDSERNNIVGAKVEINLNGEIDSTKTDAGGNFSFQLSMSRRELEEIDKFYIKVSHPNCSTERDSGEIITKNKKIINIKHDINLSCSQDTTITIYGEVIDTSSYDVKNAKVELNIGGVIKSTYTDAGGNYSFQIGEKILQDINTIRMEVSYPNCPIIRDVIPVQHPIIKKNIQMDFQLQCTPEKIINLRGEVIDNNDNEIVEATVNVILKGGKDEIYIKTDSSGNYNHEFKANELQSVKKLKIKASCSSCNSKTSKVPFKSNEQDIRKDFQLRCSNKITTLNYITLGVGVASLAATIPILITANDKYDQHLNYSNRQSSDYSAAMAIEKKEQTKNWDTAWIITGGVGLGLIASNLFFGGTKVFFKKNDSKQKIQFCFYSPNPNTYGISLIKKL